LGYTIDELYLQPQAERFFSPLPINAHPGAGCLNAGQWAAKSFRNLSPPRIVQASEKPHRFRRAPYKLKQNTPKQRLAGRFMFTIIYNLFSRAKFRYDI